MRWTVSLGLLSALALLAACGEEPQGTRAGKGAMPAYQGAQDAFVAPGWKVGDEAAWKEQLRQRLQAQNEYVRIGTL